MDTKKELPNINQDLIDCIDMLEKINQISTVRHQESLATSVRKTQALFAQTLVDSLATTSGGLTLKERTLARENKVIPAVKLVRDRIGCGLADAKEMILKWQRENGVDPSGEEQ